jgi:cytoskeletal protein CcmA (bactofilin family)
MKTCALEVAQYAAYRLKDLNPMTPITTLFGAGTRFEGKLHFEGSVRIDGWFRGSIHSEDTLVIGEGAEVFAEIRVGTVIIRGGYVEGNIKAKTALELHAPGRVVGNIHSPSLYIDKGVEFQGTCRMDAVEDEEEPLDPMQIIKVEEG